MSNKMPYIQWYPADWIAATMMLSPATRGIWFDILNVMWQLDRAEKITGTVAELARAGRCDAVQMQTAIDELTAFHVADVTERNGIVTLVCRRFKKANAERVRAANGMRVTRKLRKCDGNVTEMLQPNITEDRRQKSEKDTTASMPLTSVTDDVGAADAGGGHAPRFPQSVDDVIALADRAGATCSPEQAELYLAKRQSAGWLDRNARPIRNIGADLKAWLLTFDQIRKDEEKRRGVDDWKKKTGTLAAPPKFAKNERGL